MERRRGDYDRSLPGLVRSLADLHEQVCALQCPERERLPRASLPLSLASRISHPASPAHALYTV